MERAPLTLARSCEDTSTVSRIRSEDKHCSDDTGWPHDVSCTKARKIAVLAACFYLHFTHVGAKVALSVIYVELIEYFHSTRSEAALVQSLYGGISFACGILFTGVVLRYDAGLVVALSSLVTALCFCASAFSPSLLGVVLLVGVMAGLACSVNLLVAYIVVGWSFQEKRKAAFVVLMMGSASAQIVMPYVATFLVERFYWSDTLIILGALLFLNCIPCGFVIYYGKYCFQKGNVSTANGGKLVDMKCFTDGAFMVFLISFIALQAIGSVETWFVVDIAVLKGFSKDSGAGLLSINGLMILLSRVIGTVWLSFAPGTKLEWHMIYIFLGFGASHLIVSRSVVYWAMLLGMILRGLTAGLVFAFIRSIQADLRGIEQLPQTMAISNFLAGGGQVVGGFLGGLSFDVSGSYDAIFFSAAGVNVCNAALMVVMIVIFRQRNRRGKDYEKL